MNPISDPMSKQIDDVFDADDCVFTLTRKKPPPKASNAARSSDREDLDTKFVKLVEEARLRTEAELKRKRAESVLEARAYVPPVELPAHAEPTASDEDKVVLAKGVDPKRDPTLVGRHLGDGMQGLGGVDWRAKPRTSRTVERVPSSPARQSRLWFAMLVGLFLLVASGFAYFNTQETLLLQGHKDVSASF